jgi:pimeloyl-ACP methyl ester carboxylesterase
MINSTLRPHKILILLGIVYLIFLTGIYLLQEKIIFIPTDEIYLEIDKDKLNAEEFNLEIDKQVNIHGYFFSEKNAKDTIMFFHGNGGNLTNNFGRVAIAKKMGYNIAIFDYRGYGKSTGEIKKESDIYEDAESVYEYLVEKQKIPRNSIIFWGQSLGGAIAMEMTKRYPANKLILESTFTSLNNATPDIFKYGVPSFLKKYKFNNLEKIAGIETPVLIIHSLEDEIIPYQNGLDLFEKAKSREINQFLEIKGDHNGGFYTNFEENEGIIKEFLDK